MKISSETLNIKDFEDHMKFLLNKQISFFWINMGTLFIEIGQLKQYKNKKNVDRIRGEVTLMVNPLWNIFKKEKIECSSDLLQDEIIEKTMNYIGDRIKSISIFDDQLNIRIAFNDRQFRTMGTEFSKTDWTIFFNEFEKITPNAKYWITKNEQNIVIEKEIREDF